MIDIQEIFWSFAESSKDYVSGQDPIPEFNSQMHAAQYMLFDILTPEYRKNERVRSLLEPFTRVQPVTSDSAGVLTKPADLHMVLGGSYDSNGKRYKIYYAQENEIIESDFIPQRKADLDRGIAYFTYVNDIIQLHPKSPIPLELNYLVRPSVPKLVYSYAVTPAAFVQKDSSSVDLEWNMNAYNLLLSALLVKYSIISRDQFKIELGNFGLTIDKMNV